MDLFMTYKVEIYCLWIRSCKACTHVADGIRKAQVISCMKSHIEQIIAVIPESNEVRGMCMKLGGERGEIFDRNCVNSIFI
jgi:hypothetical protein